MFTFVAALAVSAAGLTSSIIAVKITSARTDKREAANFIHNQEVGAMAAFYSSEARLIRDEQEAVRLAQSPVASANVSITWALKLRDNFNDLGLQASKLGLVSTQRTYSAIIDLASLHARLVVDLPQLLECVHQKGADNTFCDALRGDTSEAIQKAGKVVENDVRKDLGLPPVKR